MVYWSFRSHIHIIVSLPPRTMTSYQSICMALYVRLLRVFFSFFFSSCHSVIEQKAAPKKNHIPTNLKNSRNCIFSIWSSTCLRIPFPVHLPHCSLNYLIKDFPIHLIDSGQLHFLNVLRRRKKKTFIYAHSERLRSKFRFNIDPNNKNWSICSTMQNTSGASHSPIHTNLVRLFSVFCNEISWNFKWKTKKHTHTTELKIWNRFISFCLLLQKLCLNKLSLCVSTMSKNA